MAAFPTVPVRRRLSDNVLGTGWKEGKTWSIFFSRIAVGFLFLWSGYQKVVTELAGKMATQGFLSGPSVAGSPFADFFNGLAGNWTVEYLVVGGELLIGIALLFGAFTRLGALGGMLMMLVFTVAMWPIADTPGANPVVDVRVIYALMLAMLFFLQAGLFLGLDRFFERTRVVERNPRLKLLLG